MELPNAPFYRRWSFILAGVIGLAAIVAMLGWRGLQEVATPATTTLTTTPPTTVAPTTSEPSIGPTSRPDDVLWQGEGSGGTRSDAFRAPRVWRIEWSFDCSNFKKFGGGNFKITGGGAFEDIQIEKVDIRDSGIQTISHGGYGHLLVESVCDRWAVRALSG